MTGWLATRLPWALLALCLAIVAAHMVVLWLLIPAPGIDLTAADGIANLVVIPSFVPLVAVGALIAARHPGNRFGWLLCGIGLSWEVFAFCNSYANYAFGAQDGALFGSHVALWAANWMFLPNLSLSVAFVPLLFPIGRMPEGRWRIVFWMALVGTLCATAGLAIEPATFDMLALSNDPGIANSFGVNHWIVDVLLFVGFPLSALAGIAAGVSIVVRLRRARGVERQQLKLVAYVGAIATAIFVVIAAQFPFQLHFASALWVLQILSFAAFPIAAGVAIVRHGLFDIDLLIRRTLVYGALSVCLLLTYLALVLGLGEAIRRLTGGESSIATAASTLAVAALFRPLRARIQLQVDRRFNRSNYDAAQTLDAFNARLRDEIDLATLDTELCAVVTETMQPAHVSLWLRAASSGLVVAAFTGAVDVSRVGMERPDVSTPASPRPRFQ